MLSTVLCVNNINMKSDKRELDMCDKCIVYPNNIYFQMSSRLVKKNNLSNSS